MTSIADGTTSVLCILLGGTIAMNVAAGSSIRAEISPRTSAAVGSFISAHQFEGDDSGGQLASVDHVISLVNEDSTDLRAAVWEDVVALIAESYDRYDAFLVCMGTNTLAYLSSAISFALQSAAKPVVITGSQIPFGRAWSDGRVNVLESLRWLRLAALNGWAGVYVVFGSKIIWGARAKKLGESGLEAFGSFNDSAVGEFGAGITLFERLAPAPESRAFMPENGFDERIQSVTLLPGVSAGALCTLVEHAGLRGIILRSFGSGDIPTYLFEFLDRAREWGVPVVNTTQCPNGRTVMGMNDVGRRAAERGVIPAHDMSMEAMSTKLMWLLHKGLSVEEIRKRMCISIAHELNDGLVQQASRYLTDGVQWVRGNDVRP